MKKINIVWLYNELYINNFISFYNYCKKNNNIEIIVIATDHVGNDDNITISSKEIINLLNKYKIENIDSYNPVTNTLIDISQYKPDYIFYMTPYNYYLPEQYSSKKLKKIAKVCTISYGCALINFEGNYSMMNNNEFFEDMSYFFVESKILETSIKYKAIGYLKLDEYLHGNKKILLENHHSRKSVIWKPRWTLEKNDSHLFDYIKIFSLLVLFNPRIDFKMLIHPFLYYKLKHHKQKEYFDKYVNKLKKYNNFSIIDKPEFLDEVMSADYLISDISSVIGEFSYTKRPIVYTVNDVVLNTLGNSILDSACKVKNKLSFFLTLQLLFIDIDFKKNKRLNSNHLFLKTKESAAENLYKFIENDFESNKKNN